MMLLIVAGVFVDFLSGVTPRMPKTAGVILADGAVWTWYLAWPGGSESLRPRTYTRANCYGVEFHTIPPGFFLNKVSPCVSASAQSYTHRKPQNA